MSRVNMGCVASNGVVDPRNFQILSHWNRTYTMETVRCARCGWLRMRSVAGLGAGGRRAVQAWCAAAGSRACWHRARRSPQPPPQVLTELRREMAQPHNRKLPQPPEGTNF